MLFLLKQEIGKAKTERKKEQAKASMKSFSTMVKYCEEAKCRHRVFRYLCTIPHGFGEKSFWCLSLGLGRMTPYDPSLT